MHLLSHGRCKIRFVKAIRSRQDLRWFCFADQSLDYVEEAIDPIFVVRTDRDESRRHTPSNTDSVLSIQVLLGVSFAVYFSEEKAHIRLQYQLA